MDLPVFGIGWLIAFALFLIWFWNSLYIIKEWERGAVLRLGRNAGLYERAKTTPEEVVHAITAGTPTKVSGISATASATP